MTWYPNETNIVWQFVEKFTDLYPVRLEQVMDVELLIAFMAFMESDKMAISHGCCVSLTYCNANLIAYSSTLKTEKLVVSFT